MPESPRMVPLYVARVADLRVERAVSVTCRNCGHVAEISAMVLRKRLPSHAFVKNLGREFRCQICKHKGADVDARNALGYSG